MHRHQRSPHAQRLGQRADMQATRAAERGQHEFARIDTALHRDHPQCLRHVFVGNRDHARRGLGFTDIHLLRQRSGHAPRRGHIQRHAAAQEGIRLQAPQHQVGVGHRGLVPAQPVTRRAGPGTGRLRPDLQQPAAVDPGNGTTARPDGVHVDHRHGHRPGADVALGGQADLAVDQRHVGGGAAHIKGEQAHVADLPPDEARAHQAAGGTGQQQVYGLAPGQVGAHRSAGALHDGDRRRRQSTGQAVEVTCHARPHPGIQPGGNAALVLPVFRQHLRGA